MQIPRRLNAWLTTLGEHPYVLYTLYTLVLLALFLLVNFPHDLMIRRALRQADLGRLQVNIGGARFAWHQGFEIRGLELVRADRGPDHPAMLESPRLFVQPGWSSLLGGNLTSARVNAALYRGAAEVNYHVEGGLARVDLRFANLELGMYPPLLARIQSGEIHGRVSGRVLIEAPLEDLEDARGWGELRVDNAVIHQVMLPNTAFAIPDLTYQRLFVRFTVRGSRIEIEEWEAAGEELSGTVSGQIVLRPDVRDSVLNLSVSDLHGTMPIDGLMMLLPGGPKKAKDGFAITGTLRRPRIG